MSFLQYPESLPNLDYPSAGSAERSLPVLHHAWIKARDQALAAVRAGDDLILVLGPPGTGKTLLLRDLAHILGSGGYDVLFQPRGDIPIEAAKAVAGSRKPPLPRVILVDEADRMTVAALARLRQFGAASLVCAGLNGPAHDLGHLPATVVRLAPLAPDEVGVFAAVRLTRAGRQAPPLDDQAISRLAERSGGVPRVLTMLVDAAAFLAAMDGAARICASHVDQAAEMRGDDAAPGAPPAKAEPDGALQPRVAQADQEISFLARQAAKRSPSQGRAAAVYTGQVAAMQASMVPNVPVAWAQPEDRIQPEAAASGQAASALAGQATRRPTYWSRGAALCTAAGVVVLCGWLALRPDLPAREVQPVPGKPTASAILPGGAGQDTSARGEPGAPPVLSGSQAARPAEEAAPSPAKLPIGAPAHVVIYYARNDAGAEARAADLARTLRAAGIVVDEPVAVPRGARAPGVRYFFAEDRGTAGEILGWAGLTPDSMRPGAARSGTLPRPGAVEVTVPPS